MAQIPNTQLASIASERENERLTADSGIDRRLDRLIRRRERSVAMIGFPASGKTAYLYALGKELMGSLRSDRWRILDSKSEILKVVQNMQNRAGDPWELTAALLPPMAVDLFSARRWGTRFDISSGDTSGEHYMQIADRRAPFAPDVQEYVDRLENDVLPYCAGYLLVVDCTMNPEEASQRAVDFRMIFNKIHGHGELESGVARQRRRHLGRVRPLPVAIAITKVDLLVGQQIVAPEDRCRYLRYLRETGHPTHRLTFSGSQVSYIVDAKALLGCETEPDWRAAEAIVRDYIYSHLTDFGDWLVSLEHSDDYTVRLFPVSSWGAKLKRDSDGREISPAYTEINPTGVQRPLLWLLDCMYAREWRRASQRAVARLGWAFIMLLALLPGLFHLSTYALSKTLKQGSLAQAYLASTTVRYNPYSEFLHWFNPRALTPYGRQCETLASNLYREAYSLGNDQKHKQKLEQAITLGNRSAWALHKTPSWQLDELAEIFKQARQQGLLESAALAGEEYVRIAACENPARVSDVLEVLFSEILVPPKATNSTAIDMKTKPKLESLIAWVLSLEHRLPPICKQLAVEASCRLELPSIQDKLEAMLAESYMDFEEMERSFEKWLAFDRQCAESGKPDLMREAGKILYDLASTYSDKRKAEWDDTLRRLDVRCTPCPRNEDAIDIIKEVKGIEENLEKAKTKLISRHPKFAKTLEECEADRDRIELIRTAAKLVLAPESSMEGFGLSDSGKARQQIREALSYWKARGTTVDATTQVRLRNCVLQCARNYRDKELRDYLCDQAAEIPRLGKACDAIRLDALFTQASDCFREGRLKDLDSVLAEAKLIDGGDRLIKCSESSRRMLEEGMTYVAGDPEKGYAPFYIAKHELTIREFLAFLNAQPSDRRLKIWPTIKSVNARLPVSDNDQDTQALMYRSLYASVSWREFEESPVSGVSWQAASEYCKWLAGRTGLRFRLPTEQEWQRAAGEPYPWGDEDPRDVRSEFVKITVCGQEKRDVSPVGCFDIGMNVEEWTSTPASEGKGKYIVKGMSYATWVPTRTDPQASEIVKTAWHRPLSLDLFEQGVGFRVACDPPIFSSAETESRPAATAQSQIGGADKR